MLNSEAAYSTNGETWTAISSGAGSLQRHINAVAYSPERDTWILAGGVLPTGGCPCFRWSLNGTAFDASSEPPNSLSMGLGVAWGFNSATLLGQFVATGVPAVSSQAIMFSVDGRAWTLVPQNIGDWTEGKDVRYSTFHNRWVAGGTSADVDNAIHFSSSGSSGWTKATWTGSSFTTCWKLAVSPINGVWIATGSGASYSLAISFDGTSWRLLSSAGSTFTAPSLSNDAVGITWGGGLFVTASASPVSITGSNSNAQTWTTPMAVNIGGGGSGSAFYFCHSSLLNMYLVTGATGSYAASTDSLQSWQVRPFTLFDSFMQGCAARELSRILNGNIAPNSVFQGSVVLAPGTSSTILSNATFLGSFTVNGALVLGPQASVTVFGNMTLTGSISVTQGAAVAVHGALIVLPAASLAVTTTENVVVIASFQSSNGGPFTTVTVNGMPSPCSAVVFSPSTLSVVVNSGDCGGLTLAAKIGIGIGCAVAGIALAVLIVLCTKYFIGRRQHALQLKLQQDMLEQVDQKL